MLRSSFRSIRGLLHFIVFSTALFSLSEYVADQLIDLEYRYPNIHLKFPRISITFLELTLRELNRALVIKNKELKWISASLSTV